MTQYSANPLVEKKEVAPKKGSLITYRVPNSPYLYFKIAGGGTIPRQLKGGWLSQVDADKARMKYENRDKNASTQESETYISAAALKALTRKPEARAA